VALLRRIRTQGARAGGVVLRPLGDEGVRVEFVAGMQVSVVDVKTEPKPPYKISSLTLTESKRHRPSDPPVTWDTLASRLREAAGRGFSGTVLVLRDGKEFLHAGYGLADRERGLPCTPTTLFDIGSTPIDFTKAAILKLEEMGKLDVADRIGHYLPDVPEDKKEITLRHLMEGKSGLPNFHHIPGQDADYDLTWIDRDTAVKRILSSKLLFPPGESYAHSHSAWGLLAAIVEIVSGQSYGEFLNKQFFEPIGMKHTGFYGRDERFEDTAYAVGYGGSRPTKINSPYYWGDTSWLIMGSGGMFSTTGDLYQWMRAIRSGRVLTPDAARRYWSHRILAGGTDRGFLCMYSEGPQTLAIVMTNANAERDDLSSRLAEQVVRFARPDNDKR